MIHIVDSAEYDYFTYLQAALTLNPIHKGTPISKFEIYPLLLYAHPNEQN